jgi:hypothetical protein
MSRHPAGSRPDRAAPSAPLAPVGPGALVLTERCRSAVRRALAADPLLVLLGRASNPSGNQATDLAASSVVNGAAELERQGIRVRHLLPPLTVLKHHHHDTATVERIEALGGGLIEHRWSTWGGLDSGLLVIMTTGSGTKIALEHFEQPAVARIARLVLQHQPAVVYARALHRIGRDHLGPLIAVLQAMAQTREDGPFIGDDEIALGELDEGMEWRLTTQSLVAKYQARGLVRDNQVGMRARTGVRHETWPGVWWFASPRPAPPGLTKLTLRTFDNARPRTALVLDCPAARPPEAMIAGGLRPPRTPKGKVADQVALVRWIGEHLYTDGWDARGCAAHLAEHGWAPPAIRQRHRISNFDGTVSEAPALQLRSGADGRNDGRKALRAFLANLTFYETGDLVVTLADGGEPKRITGVLPLDGRPWITAAQAERIRTAERRRHCGPAHRHLFAGLPVTVDGQAAVLYPRSRANGEVVYHLRRAADPRRPAGGPRAGVLPPLPHATLAEWYAAAFARLALPLSLLLADRPTTADPWQAKVRVLKSEVARLDEALIQRKNALDPADRTAHPVSYQHLKDLVEKTDQTLRGKREDLKMAQRQHRQHQHSPVLAGAPLAKLVALAAALPQPYDQGHRLLLRDVTGELAIRTSKRSATGRRPAYDFDARLTVQVHDGTDAWRGVSEHRWTGGPVLRTPARVAEAVGALYAGVPLRASLGADWRSWLPAVRAALGCRGAFQFAWTEDPRLLRLGMAVVHPRRADAGDPGDPTPSRRLADPPLNPAALPALARRLGEPVRLLREIHAIYTAPRPARWLRNPSPAVVAA